MSENIIKSAVQWRKWNDPLSREKKRLVFCETTIRWWTEGGLRESSQQWPYLSPLPPYQWLDQAWWMTGGDREGWGVDWTYFQSCPSPHNVRNTRDCCVRATEGWRGVKGGGVGMVDAVGWSRGSAVKDVYRRISSGWVALGGCWHPAWMNMYVPPLNCSKDGPPG